jgi:VWFA-related protein
MRRGRYCSRTVVFILLCFAETAFSQSPAPSLQSPKLPSSTSPSAIATFQASTRMVTLEVVVKDRQGHHVAGLAAGDFQVFEQSPSRGKDKHEQKIAAFREIQVADLPSPDIGQVSATDGIFTNAVVPTTEPIPPTILLLDGLNTEVKFQAQVHVQMVKMLKSLPKNVPVAVFLFGHRLRMLQDFTTDPSLLQAALEKAGTTAGEGVARLDPRDDPGAISSFFDKINGATGGNSNSTGLAELPGASVGSSGHRIEQWVVDAVKRFEQEVYAGSMDTRVQQTVEALASLGRHVAGYPGRKNLLWISTSFPINLSPLIDDSGKPITDITGLDSAGQRNYSPKLRVLVKVLSDAKVSVYPISPAGVQAPTLFEADNRLRDYSGKSAGDSLRRETMVRANEQDTMQVIAQGTGGQVCAGNNDLGDCLRRAMDDSSTFYEISYYPDSLNWNGEYRTVSVKARQSGLHLAYRPGYYAGEEAKDASDQKTQLREAACEDYLDASAILLTAQSVAPDSPEKLKFYLTMKASDLTLTPASDGTKDLDITVAACTFDKNGWPIQFMTDTVRRRFDSKESQSLSALGGLPHVVSVPGPRPVSVRLLVRDEKSGRIGSLHMKVDQLVPTPMSKAGAPVQPELAP